MEAPTMCTAGTATVTTTTTHQPPLHTLEPLHRTATNRSFALVYTCAILSLFYYHATKIIHHYQSTTSLACFFISITLFVSDIVLVFMWITAQCFRMRPIRRQTFIENLKKRFTELDNDFPALDVFICTADPYKEPPMRVVNTALSVMAYDYPTDKISVYISDDGGSQITLFALMEASQFSRYWLPFCKKYNIVERSPEAYFKSKSPCCSENPKIKMMYESMKVRVENVVRGEIVGDEYVNAEEEKEAFRKWSDKFTSQDHPTVIQVLLESDNDKDIVGCPMPNLIYVSRQKCRTSFHNFKAGALNVLLRISATMTNAPIILTLDCDVYSNDPQTPQHALCYFSDPTILSKLGYVQFPQRFYGIDKYDIYACDYRRMFQITPMGIDGLGGPDYVGTGCFFNRRAFFGGPSSFVPPEISDLSPNYPIKTPFRSQPILALAHYVADCSYENETKWGFKMGFRYGSLVEDTNTGYHLQCEGWRSVFCNPERAAFLGDAPNNLTDVLIQSKRWCVGLLEMGFSRYSPLTYGTRILGPHMALCYSHYAFWPIWSIPITIYGFLPQLALLNGVSIFPKIPGEILSIDSIHSFKSFIGLKLGPRPWFFLYAFLFIGAYTQDILEFIMAKGTLQRWWSEQRMWMIRGLTCYLFGSLEYLLLIFNTSNKMLEFNVTNKAQMVDEDDEQSSKRYRNGIFEFGMESSTAMFVPLTMAAIINLVSFMNVFMEVLQRGWSCLEGLFVQTFIAGFVLVNCFPLYEAMIFRTDKGKIPGKITVISTILALVLYTTFSLTLWISN